MTGQTGPSIIVLSPGFLTTVQDAGRRGYQRFGVTPSGPIDWFAHRAANRLVNNPPGAAALEFAILGPVLRAGQDVLVAGAGRGYTLRIGGRALGLWMAAWARAGEIIEVLPVEGAAGWGVLAISGGIDTPPALGSRATHLRGGFGGLDGRALQTGDRLPLGQPADRRIKALAGRWLPPSRRPAYGDEVELPVIPGPQAHFFSAETVAAFYASEYTVTPSSDRMGYRLQGPPLAHRTGAELLSEGMPLGSVQVPPGGQPVVMMCDHGTTGGYPKIAVVALAGIPLLAGLLPGKGKARFQAVSVDEAQARCRALVEGIETGFE